MNELVIDLKGESPSLATALSTCDLDRLAVRNRWSSGRDVGIQGTEAVRHQAALMEVAVLRRHKRRLEARLKAISSLSCSEDVKWVTAIYTAAHRAFSGRVLNVWKERSRYDWAVDCGWKGFDYDPERDEFTGDVGSGLVVVKVNREDDDEEASVYYVPQFSVVVVPVLNAEVEAVEMFAQELAEDAEVNAVKVVLNGSSQR